MMPLSAADMRDFMKMRRVTKRGLLFFIGVMFTGFYCEFLIYYVVIAQCQWPILDVEQGRDETLKAFILSDPHLLGPRRGHWLDKWRREWQMRQAFHAIITMHKPDVVFILGDLFDEGEWSNNKQFDGYVERFYKLFSVPHGIKMHVLAGNHDIGFHNFIRRGSVQRFANSLNASNVQLLTLKNNHFVLLNSMAMEGDSCDLCTQARRRIDGISEILKCSQDPIYCSSVKKKLNYSQPILLQHFPLYRFSDEICTEPDAPPLSERNIPFLQKIDALSKEATEYLISKIKPRAVFGGHTHHGCLVQHKFGNPAKVDFFEYSVPSFSWRNRPDPKYMLVTFTPNAYAVSKCGLPKETTIVITAVIFLFLITVYTVRKRTIGTDW